MVRIRKHLKYILTRTAAPIIPSSEALRPSCVIPPHNQVLFSAPVIISLPTLPAAQASLGIPPTQDGATSLLVNASQVRSAFPPDEPMCIDVEDVEMLDMTDTPIDMEDLSPPTIRRQHGRCLNLPFPITTATVPTIPMHRRFVPILPESYLSLPRLPTIYDNIDSNLTGSSSNETTLHHKDSSPASPFLAPIENRPAIPFAERSPQPLFYEQFIQSPPQLQWTMNLNKTIPEQTSLHAMRSRPNCARPTVEPRTWHSGLKGNGEVKAPLVHQDSCHGTKRSRSVFLQTILGIAASILILIHVANGVMKTSFTVTKLLVSAINEVAKPVFARVLTYFETGKPVIRPALTSELEEDANEEAEVLDQLLS